VDRFDPSPCRRMPVITIRAVNLACYCTNIFAPFRLPLIHWQINFACALFFFCSPLIFTPQPNPSFSIHTRFTHEIINFFPSFSSFPSRRSRQKQLHSVLSVDLTPFSFLIPSIQVELTRIVVYSGKLIVAAVAPEP